jgi:RNase P subunit RPR2
MVLDMGCRKRINPAAVCSSDNYKRSRELHNDYIRKVHEQNKEMVIEISKEIKTTLHAYVMCFGTRVEITLEEAQQLSTQIKVIYE